VANIIQKIYGFGYYLKMLLAVISIRDTLLLGEEAWWLKEV